MSSLLKRSPLVWLSRVGQRRGYGIHSPFAYRFVRGVVLEGSAYYAYEPLLEQHPWRERVLLSHAVKCHRLLFRLANFVHPRAFAIVGHRPTAEAYLRAAVPSAESVSITSTPPPELVLVAAERAAEARSLLSQMPAKGMLIVEGIHHSPRHRQLWAELKDDPRTGITFDTYNYGILLFDHTLHKQHYTICF